jgi:dihydropteroate synthase
MSIFKFKNRFWELGKRTLVMGVHNATPDSFSDGGNYEKVSEAVEHCIQMIKNGADIIDIGGESTRPGDDSVVAVEEELNRVIPIIGELKKKYPNSIVSIDTIKPEVAREAVSNGADIINDVSGLKFSKDIAKVAADTKVGLILMHMKESPKAKNSDYKYENLLKEIKDFLINAAQTAQNLGVSKESIILDPGLGGGCFGKSMEQNCKILANIQYFKQTGYPILAGPSRKSFIGTLLSAPLPQDRVWGTAAATAWLAGEKIDIVRVHDVKAMSQVLKTYEAITSQVQKSTC